MFLLPVLDIHVHVGQYGGMLVATYSIAYCTAMVLCGLNAQESTYLGPIAIIMHLLHVVVVWVFVVPRPTCIG